MTLKSQLRGNMAKSSGGTGRSGSGNKSRGETLREKYGSQEAAISKKFPDRFKAGAALPASLKRTQKSEGTRAAIASGKRSAADEAATAKSVARRARKLGMAPKGGDAATRAGAQKAAQRKARSANASFDRAISGRKNVKRKSGAGNKTARRLGRTGALAGL